jgi:hypothetical protein
VVQSAMAQFGFLIHITGMINLHYSNSAVKCAMAVVQGDCLNEVRNNAS